VNFIDFKKHFEAFRDSADDEALSLKDSQLALLRLEELYKKFDARERLMADQLLMEWSLSENEGIRFDALALISHFNIVKAVPALRQLSERLAESVAVSAPFELEKVNKLIAKLSAVKRVEDI
jgi:hypothetical protein